MQQDNYSKELAHFFDMLRVSRKMTLEDLTHDIVSIRQFRRYIRGEYQMSATIFNQLSNRLGFKPEHILLDFEAIKLQESKKINDFHNAIVNKNFKLARSHYQAINPENIIEKNNQLLLSYATNLLHYYEGTITPNYFIKNIKELIDFNSLMEKSILSSTEVIILTSLMPIPNFDQKDLIAKLLESFINHQKTIVSGHNDRMLLLCLYHLSDYYGTQGNFNQVLIYCKKGIEFCNYLKFNYLLQDFYYYSALAYHYLNLTDESSQMLFKCFCVLHAESNPDKIKKYYQLIESDFNINYDQYILNYISKKKNLN